MTARQSAISRGIRFTTSGSGFLAFGITAILWYMLPWFLLVSFVGSGAATVWPDIDSPRAFGVGFLGVLVYYSATITLLVFSWRGITAFREGWENRRELSKVSVPV